MARAQDPVRPRARPRRAAGLGDAAPAGVEAAAGDESAAEHSHLPAVNEQAPAEPTPIAAAIDEAVAERAFIETAPAPVAETAIAAAEAAASLAPLPPTSQPTTEPNRGPITMDQPTTSPFSMPTFSMDPEAMRSAFGDMSERAKGAMEKSAKMVEDMTDFARGNVEAVMSSSRVAAKGAETIGQDFADYSRKSFEGAAAAFKSFVAAKSPTELFRLQSDYARSAFDTAVAEGSRITETMLKLAGEIAQPLSSRVAVAAEKIKTPAL